MIDSPTLAEAVGAALRQGFGTFWLPDTSPSQLAAMIPPRTALRNYRGNAVHELRPVDATRARPGTLSARHGDGAFPPHVDGAHLPTPPRLIVLWCAEEEQNRATLLYGWDQVETVVGRPPAEREVFDYRNGRASRRSTIVSPDHPYLRYDPGCMRPATRGAKELLIAIDRALSNQAPHLVNWAPGLGVVIDNWHVLHGRATGESGGARRLFRLWLDASEESAG